VVGVSFCTYRWGGRGEEGEEMAGRGRTVRREGGGEGGGPHVHSTGE